MTNFQFFRSALATSLFLIFGASLYGDWNQVDSVNWHSPAENWEEVNSGISPRKDGIWTGDHFVAFADSDGTIGVSADGLEWEQISGISGVRKLAMGSGEMMAIASFSRGFRSEDGRDWERVWSGLRGSLNDIVYGDGIWVAVGDSILVSEDGFEWESENLSSKPRLQFIDYGNDHFVALNGNVSYISSDGRNWNEYPVSIFDGKKITRLAFLKDRFFAATDEGVFVSFDGSEWEGISSLNDSGIKISDLGHFKNRYAAVGIKDRFPVFLTSFDAENWRAEHLPFRSSYGENGMIAGEEALILAGDPYSSSILRADLHHPIRKIYAVAHGNDRFAAVGTNGRAIYSSDGIEWEEATAPALDDLQDIVFAEDHFVAVGSNGALIISEDGENWESRNSGVERFLLGVAHGNGRTVAVGGNGALRYSDDLNVWEKGSIFIPGPFSSDLPPLTHRIHLTTFRSVAFGNGTFAAVGHDGTILRSSDGAEWEISTRNLTDSLNSVAFGNGQFV